MVANLSADDIKQTVLALPELAAWPEIAALFLKAQANEAVRLDWQLPALASRAVGGAETAALPAVGAIACLQISIILVDDMLDQDPRGTYHRLGAGRTANVALAFQAAGLNLIGRAPAPPAARAAATAALSAAALATAFGQELDVQNLRGEENYWRVVRAKSTPFYGAALQTGALLGGADPSLAQGIYDFGVVLGEMIQIFDDLVDAFEAPANPDWGEGRNNLAILYARTADHPGRAEFLRMVADTGDPRVLHEAQKFLISSGAVSYCMYQQLQRHRIGRAILDRLELADSAPMSELLRNQVDPLTRWLQDIGAAVPEEIARMIA